MKINFFNYPIQSGIEVFIYMISLLISFYVSIHHHIFILFIIGTFILGVSLLSGSFLLKLVRLLLLVIIVPQYIVFVLIKNLIK